MASLTDFRIIKYCKSFLNKYNLFIPKKVNNDAFDFVIKLEFNY